MHSEVTYEPAPAGTLDGSSRSVKLLLEVIEGAKVAGDELLELAILELGLGGLRGSQVLPEKRVVDMACGERRSGVRSESAYVKIG